MSMKKLKCECEHASHVGKKRTAHKPMQSFVDEFMTQVRTIRGTMLICEDCYWNCLSEGQRK